MAVTLNEDGWKLDMILKRAEEFHGHLGPFLVLGVRMAITGVRELEAEGNEKELRVTVRLKDSVPFSCVIDGIQVTSKCTIGNKKLRMKNAPGIAARFEHPKRGQVTVSVNSTSFEMLKDKLLSEKVSQQELRKLAKVIADMPEKNLFVTKRKIFL